MRRFIFTLIAFSITFSLLAQNKKKMTNPNTHWKKGGWISAYVAQSGARNWAAGSEKFSLTFASYLDLWAKRTAGKNTWSNYLDVGYSMINTHDQGVRKLDDKLDFVTQYTYDLKSKISVGFWANMRTQLTNGYDYTETPRKRISGFAAPAYMTFAPGVEWRATSYWSFFISPWAVRWIAITNKPYSFNYQGGIKPDGSSERSLASLYSVDPGRQARVEMGPFITTKFNKDLFKNVHYSSRLDLLSDNKHEEPFNIKVYWTNMIGMRVNKWLHVTYSYDIIYDDAIKMFGRSKTSAAMQFKSLLGVGVIGKF